MPFCSLVIFYSVFPIIDMAIAVIAVRVIGKIVLFIISRQTISVGQSPNHKDADNHHYDHTEQGLHDQQCHRYTDKQCGENHRNLATRATPLHPGTDDLHAQRITARVLTLSRTYSLIRAHRAPL
ncbi:MAG: hypothetical protein CL549_14070 [Alcanivorax sp.]|nr:hypothetical protein [Alcanivorax sp.]MAY11586.1 hypothetical protein [Alcanivorax sp.]MBI54063.1 hypothetical protein [Alcanivorax sp.]